MKLYVKSLGKFQKLFDSNEYLQAILTPTNSNVYFIETDDLSGKGNFIYNVVDPD